MGPTGIDQVVARMDGLLAGMAERKDQRRIFLSSYRRITLAVKEEVERGGFLDGEWVERWDVAFASLYLDAVEQWNAGQGAPGPWAVTFEAALDPAVPPLRHVLLAINAHVNYDLAQALLATITDDEFDDAELVSRRAADHRHVDDVLASKVAAEDRELKAFELPGQRTTLDRLLTPFNRLATKRFLKEARAKVWHNARLMSTARRRGSGALEARLRQLEDLARARVADLRAPGQVVLRLAVRGFGVSLAD